MIFLFLNKNKLFFNQSVGQLVWHCRRVSYIANLYVSLLYNPSILSSSLSLFFLTRSVVWKKNWGNCGILAGELVRFLWKWRNILGSFGRLEYSKTFRLKRDKICTTFKSLLRKITIFNWLGLNISYFYSIEMKLYKE